MMSIVSENESECSLNDTEGMLDCWQTTEYTEGDLKFLQFAKCVEECDRKNRMWSGGDNYSRKVFVGGLPPDIDEGEISCSFARFGEHEIDWPHKTESPCQFPPKGYCFLLFRRETSVLLLTSSCFRSGGKLFWRVSSPSCISKAVQIRPWRLVDANCVLDDTKSIDPRLTIFVGGVPRPLKSVELALLLNDQFGNVCYAGIDTDCELRYPKGAARVAFCQQSSYIAAISSRFAHLQLGDISKRVEIKPYVLDDQDCDECSAQALYFCGHLNCLQYFCQNCWDSFHQQPSRRQHKPLLKEGS
ncbi:translational regulator orb2-like [Octopus sinensis]|uniref:Translational regulator orb2-like n=1 Tax=Octopus sinensis TaxID=2607531 RepID=A0A6P7UAI6_9MOLL|nr:translational regulator orb2-like [Octopus sinensis]